MTKKNESKKIEIKKKEITKERKKKSAMTKFIRRFLVSLLRVQWCRHQTDIFGNTDQIL